MCIDVDRILASYTKYTLMMYLDLDNLVLYMEVCLT